MRHLVLVQSMIIFNTLFLAATKQLYEWYLSGEPDYFGRNKISSGGDLSHYSSASLY